jgi:hypothetical protein
MGSRSCLSCSTAKLCGVGMRIECLCLLRASADACIRVVFLARDRLGRGGDDSSRERGPQPG